MKVLQFGFDTAEVNDYRPHTYEKNSVVYTGTHDNDTVVGWLAGATKRDREFALRYLASNGREPHWDFIRGALLSPSQFAVVPMQDLLGLGSEARMNRPGVLGGNWQWRMPAGAASETLAARLGEMSELYGRV
jgi:4-alpha-glucanotransferase